MNTVARPPSLIDTQMIDATVILKPLYTGPSLFIRKSIISQQVAEFKKALPHVKPHFAVKANPLPELITHLKHEGVAFEIASQGELDLLIKLGVPGKDIIFSNPIKTVNSIKAAVEYGVNWFSFDTIEELNKLHILAPNAFYELRLSTSGEGSVWPLTTKFGLDDDDAQTMIRYGAKHNMNIAGLTFHVGSQCTRAQSWVEAVERCKKHFELMLELGLPVKLLNVGGGYPCAVSETAMPLTDLMAPLRRCLTSLDQNIELVAEPGRFLVAAAGTIECEVISTTVRKSQPWAYLDCGYYNGLLELTENFGYTLQNQTQQVTEMINWTIAGPTCDSVDMFKPFYQLPKNTQAGDIIHIPNMGAYTNTCATEFNGFAMPKIIISE